MRCMENVQACFHFLLHIFFHAVICSSGSQSLNKIHDNPPQIIDLITKSIQMEYVEVPGIQNKIQ